MMRKQGECKYCRKTRGIVAHQLCEQCYRYSIRVEGDPANIYRCKTYADKVLAILCHAFECDPIDLGGVILEKRTQMGASN
jgi:hypothetical protein